MKKRLQGLFVGVLIGIMLASGSVFAKKVSEMAEIFYSNIKIYIDGAEIVPKDANGNVVEPFIYNGTTYLPVRAISNAFGKEVEWDGIEKIVYIGKKNATEPDNYLDKIQYNDYKEGNDRNDFTIINGTVTDVNGIVYTNGLLFKRASMGGVIREDSDEPNFLISYPLNSRYSNLKGKIVLPKKHDIATWGKKDNCGTTQTDILFYGDGKLLYRATSVTESMPFDIDLNTQGVNQLMVKIKVPGSSCYVALTDLALYE